MGFVVRIYDIDFENDFTVSYIETNSLTDLDTGFIFKGVYQFFVTTVEFTEFEFNKKYWVKLVDNVNGKTIVKNIYTHDSKYYECYDQIDFRVELDGDFCDLDDTGLNITVSLYDNVLPNGNNSSVVNSNTNSYRLYRGDDINSIFTDTMTFIANVGPPDPVTKLIYQYNETEEGEYYLFLVHGDGFNVTNYLQGGFGVRKVKIVNSKRENTGLYKFMTMTTSSSYKGTPINKAIVLNTKGDLLSPGNFNATTTSFSNTVLISLNNDLIFSGGSYTFSGLKYGILLKPNAFLDTIYRFQNIQRFSGGNVQSAIEQPDGKLIVGGGFTFYDGILANRRVRLNRDFTIDTTFESSTLVSNTVMSCVLQNDGKIVMGGFFVTFNDVTQNRIVRLNTDGTTDNTFNIGTGVSNGSVTSLTMQSDGKILMSSGGVTYNGNDIKGLCRLNTDGTFDNTFNTGLGFSSAPTFMKILPDNKIIAGGSFTTFNGITQNRFIRLNLDGTIDNTFNIGTGFSASTSDFNLLPDGRYLITGSFSIYNGVTVNGICILFPDGSLDTSFVGSDTYISTNKTVLIK
jgi:uncharacterized delta-60 repeat protein